jgi:lysophospholipase L1-like esterase
VNGSFLPRSGVRSLSVVVSSLLLVGLCSAAHLSCARAETKQAVRPAAKPTPVAAARATTEPTGPGLAAYKVKPAYEKAIKQFEIVATTRPSPTGGTVFIGSSSFTRWKTLEKDEARFKAINRGFGGSRTDDVLYYAHRLIAPLKPTRIVYYCGTNDLASKRPAATAVANFEAFVTAARQESPGVEIFFVAANVTPKRTMFSLGYRQVNAEVAQWARTVPGVHFIDATVGLVDAKGQPKPELFVKDGIHLNDQGYKIWRANIERALVADQSEALTASHTTPAASNQ